MRLVLEDGEPRLRHSPPPPLAGEPAVLIEVELAGLCRSDLKEVAGTRYGPSQFGHELVGTVRESTARDLPEGTRVVLDPNVVVDRGSGFADRMRVAGPAQLLRRALPVVPGGTDARRLVFAEPLACARHCLSAVERRLGGLAGARVAVLGAGTAGLLIACLARLAGAEAVLANRGAERLAAVRAAGLLDGPVVAYGDLADARADAAVVATSFVVPEVLRHALRAVVPGGLVMLYGGTAPGDALPGLDCDLDTVRRTEGLAAARWHGRPVRVAGSYGTTPHDFAAAVSVLTDPSAPLAAERTVTREVTLGRLHTLLRDRGTALPPGKILVRPAPPP